MSPRSAKILLAAIVFIGAMLLFLVQPLVTKEIVPWFGGSAAVWTSAVLLFQTLLLGGYLYAHLTTSKLPNKAQPWIHAVLLAAALAMLPIIPPLGLRPEATTSPIWRVLLVILITAGLPFLVLSSTSTLAQAWWHRIDPNSPPYGLYALSNTGSLVGLLAYPLVLEPLVGLRYQASIWSGAMCVYAVLSLACAVIASRKPSAYQAAIVQRPAAARLLVWLLWPAISSLLLLALTASISQRVAPIPFLWVLPLSVYLVTFIICFERPALYARKLYMPAYMVLLTAFSLFMLLAVRIPIWQQLAMTSALLFCGCMICHGELYRCRPPAAGLTLYYLVIAFGSVIGSLLAAIVAPLVFRAFWELHISLAAIAAGVLLVIWVSRDSRLRAGRPAVAWFVIGIWASITGLLLWLDAQGSYGLTTLVERSRSFYGAITIREAYRKEIGSPVRTLYHDGIVHGLQGLKPELSSEPLSYYWKDSAFGRLMRATESRPRKIGIVGLGAGAICSWARENDEVVFYELDPLMIDVARREFTYLANCRAPVKVIPGDARLSLERQQDQAFDVLILDAFSGNAVPVHLLTIEAMDTYRRHLKPEGVLAIHISNHYLDLEPVIARIAETTAIPTAILNTPTGIPDDIYQATDVAVFCPSRELLEDPLLKKFAHAPKIRPSLHLWTDDHSNMLQLLK